MDLKLTSKKDLTEIQLNYDTVKSLIIKLKLTKLVILILKNGLSIKK